MKELVEYIAKTLVDHPEELHITEIEGERTIVFELRCNDEDVGKIIGHLDELGFRNVLILCSERPIRKNNLLTL